MEFKQEANVLFVDEAYTEAIDAYTRMISSKRAAAYLKLNKFKEADQADQAATKSIDPR